ncbi:MAG: flavodoxin [Candidatus Omnitrophica bacterium]|nr:flavodoxin [Candidatus Omnitrophota bacterium]MDD5351635.1 flavodoxin [Candidatus Omnitrophota bacterium]MDD5550845.1 flavodoxin [Candidatus Omnitrophota bacterium]
MRSAIIYYSYSGNTRKVAQELKKYLEKQGSVELAELKPLDESDNFFVQSKRALFGKEAIIENTQFDLTGFDVICLGTPVWAFGPSPAMNTFLKKCFGLKNKTVVIFTTYGSGTGNNKCIRKIQKTLQPQGVKQFRSFSVQQSKVKDNNFILNILAKVL